MKKNFCLIFILLSFTFTSCTTEKYLKQVPTLDIGSLWISEDPNMYFFADSERSYGYGRIIIEEKIVEVQAKTDYGHNIVFYYYRENEMNSIDDRLYSGKWKRDGDTLTVTTKDDDVFEGKYETITFTRHLQSDYPELED